jgi:PKD repeat protein
MKRFLLFSLIFTLSVFQAFSQGDFCVESEPFCTNDLYSFPAGVNSGFAEPGPDYGCLEGNRKNPAWYHLKIATSGDINIYMFSTPSEDIDFICWGPFTDPVTPCNDQLTSNKIVDCSWSWHSYEDCFIPNSQMGEYYILLITNYSDNPCDITFEKTSGTGETDCSIVPPPIGSNTPLCVGETLQLWADDFDGAAYHWTGPDGFSSSQQNPSISNVGMENAGDYQLIITVGGSSSDAVSTTVEIFPNSVPDFDFNIACLGDNTIFQDLSTVDPPGNPITTWEWDFGDGETSTEQNPTHLYATAGDFEVSLTTYTGIMNCAQSIIKTVSVSPAPIPDFEFTIACLGEETQFDDLSSIIPPGDPISAWEWNFGDGQTGSGQHTTHLYSTIGDYNVTLTIYVGDMGCEQSITKTISIIPPPTPDFSFTSECLGNTTVFTDLSTSQTTEPITTWQWDFGDGESAYGQEISHTYETAGNFQVTLTIYTGSLACEQSITKTVPVFSNAMVDAGNDQSIPNGWTAELNATITEGSGNYNIFWTPEALLDNPNIEDPETVALTATQVFTLTVIDAVSLCENSDQTTVIVTGGALYVIATADAEEICNGEEVQLSANSIGGSGNYTYSWTSDPPGFNSNLEEPVDSPNITTTYFVVVNDGQSSVNGEVTVNVLPQSVPNFDANNACFGEPTYFTDASTVDPPTAIITAWEWSFGDGQTSNGQNVNHTYGVAGDYEVSLTTFTGNMNCPQTTSKTVQVYNAANVDAGADQTIPNGWTVELDGTINGASGNYDILWTPQNLLVDPYIEDPQTQIMSSTQEFTLSVTDINTQCENSDVTTVIVTGGALAVTATVNPAIICEGELVQLTANPSGGSGNNTYSWTSNPPGFTANIKEPSDFPTENTTYYVEVNDGQSSVNGEVTLQVNPKPIANAGIDKTITVGTNTILDGTIASGGSGNYSYSWLPIEMLVNPTDIYPQTEVLLESTEFTLVVNDDNGCVSNEDKVWVFAGGDGLNINPTASQDVICKEDSTQLNANAYGGGGNYTYNWSDGNGFESTEAIIWVFPTQTTTYFLDVSDGFINVSESVTISVNVLPIIDLLPEGYEYYQNSNDTIKACVKDSVILNAGNIDNPSSMNYLWSNSSTSQKLKVTTVGSWIDFKTNSVIVENPVTLCKESKSMTIFFDFNECEIGINEINSLSENISISPNPNKGMFYLKTYDLDETVNIFIDDINGKNIFHENNVKLMKHESEKLIDISNFPDGIYLLNIISNNGIYRTKIVKQ